MTVLVDVQSLNLAIIFSVPLCHGRRWGSLGVRHRPWAGVAGGETEQDRTVRLLPVVVLQEAPLHDEAGDRHDNADHQVQGAGGRVEQGRQALHHHGRAA